MEIGKIIKNNAKVYVILSVIILLGTIGVSYALVMGTFNNIGINTSTDEIKASITYDDSSSAKIESMGEMTPISDSEVDINTNDKRVIKTKFNVIGSASNPDKSIYDISLRDINIDCELRSKEVKWRLYKEDKVISEGNLSPAFDTMNNNRLVLTKIQEDLTTNTDSYTFLLWISEACDGDINNCSEEQDQSKYLNKHLSGNIAIEVTTKSKKKLERLTGDENSCTYIEELIPQCNKLTYNGKEQELIKESSNYTLENNLGLDAREYKVIARLKEGYKWNTGETKERVLSCNIGKKDLSIKSLDQTIIYGDKISSNLDNIEVSGLAEGDSIKEVNLSTSISGVGEGVIRVDSIVIVGSTGREVTDNYNIKINSEGRLTILGGDLTITIKDAKYTYDGKEKVHGEVTVIDKDNKEIKDLDIGYKYYEDNSCTKELNKLPVNAGNYYVKGMLEEQRGYKSTESNCANILIEKAESKIEVDTDKVELVHPEEKNISYKYTGDGEITCESDSPSIATCEVDKENKEVIVKSVSEGNTKIKVKINEGRNYKEAEKDIEVSVIYRNFDLTYDYDLTETYAAGTALNTGYKIDWDKDFTLKVKFNVSTLGKVYLIIGNYPSTNGSLSVEVAANNTLRLWLDNGKLETYSSETITAGEDIEAVFSYTASTGTYTVTAKGNKTNINMNGTHKMNGISSSNLLVGGIDNRPGSNPFNTITVKGISLTRKYRYYDKVGDMVTPERVGYTFGGWYSGKGGNGSLLKSTDEMTSNRTVYAKYTPKNYTITYNYQNNIASEDTTQYIFQGSSATDRDHQFPLWVYSNAGAWTGIKIPLLPHKKPNTNYIISYSSYRTVSIDGNLIVYPPTYDASGGVISYNDNAATNTTNSNSPLNTWTKHERTFNSGSYSTWPELYIYYDKANQGLVQVKDIRIDEYSTETKTYGEVYGEMPVPVRTGYTFQGWYTSPDGQGTKINEDTPISAENKTLYASWKKVQHKLTVDPNGGSFNGNNAVSTYTGDYGNVMLLPKPTREGYTFTGWTLTTGKGTVTKYGNGLYNDETFATSNNSMVVYNNSVNGLVKHTKIVASNDSPIRNASQMIQITTSGKVEPGLGGFWQKTQSKASGVFYHVVVAKVPVGYNLAIGSNAVGNEGAYKWLTSSEGTGEFETYIYKLNCGSTGNFKLFGLLYLQGAEATAEKPVTWYVAYANMFDATDGTTNEDTTQTYTFGGGDGTLTAKWTPITYTITFNANGGSLGKVPPTMTKQYGVTLKLPTEVPTRPGYTFLGWSTSNTATSATYPAGGNYTSNAGGTLYAVWKLNTVNLATYITNLYNNAEKSNSVFRWDYRYDYFKYASSVGLMDASYNIPNSLVSAENIIRYVGGNPNNYIYFNCTDYNNQSSSTCELWRIIGVFDGKVKLIRNESIGNLYLGDYDWAKPSSLNTYLNSTYYNSLKNDATRNMISTHNWYMGADGTYEDASKMSAVGFYASERVNRACNGCSYSRWTGKIALMSASDYGFASPVCSDGLNNYSKCSSSNWLYKANGTCLLLNRSTNVNNSGFIIFEGSIRQNSMSDGAVYPAFYLATTQTIKQGNAGSSSDPYQLKA